MSVQIGLAIAVALTIGVVWRRRLRTGATREWSQLRSESPWERASLALSVCDPLTFSWMGVASLICVAGGFGLLDAMALLVGYVLGTTWKLRNGTGSRKPVLSEAMPLALRSVMVRGFVSSIGLIVAVILGSSVLATTSETCAANSGISDVYWFVAILTLGLGATALAGVAGAQNLLLAARIGTILALGLLVGVLGSVFAWRLFIEQELAYTQSTSTPTQIVQVWQDGAAIVNEEPLESNEPVKLTGKSRSKLSEGVPVWTRIESDVDGGVKISFEPHELSFLGAIVLPRSTQIEGKNQNATWFVIAILSRFLTLTLGAASFPPFLQGFCGHENPEEARILRSRGWLILFGVFLVTLLVASLTLLLGQWRLSEPFLTYITTLEKTSLLGAAFFWAALLLLAVGIVSTGLANVGLVVLRDYVAGVLRYQVDEVQRVRILSATLVLTATCMIVAHWTLNLSNGGRGPSLVINLCSAGVFPILFAQAQKTHPSPRVIGSVVSLSLALSLAVWLATQWFYSPPEFMTARHGFTWEIPAPGFEPGGAIGLLAAGCLKVASARKSSVQST